MQQNMIQNPVLRGFNPDASVVKVGKDFYIATSTFEWWPGVEIYHSTNLVNWDVISQPLNTLEKVNLIGNYNSGSIWAPHLSYSEGKFWLLYTDVKSGTAFKDTLNYVISATDITGPWSEPVFVTASGFDPAFFHDDDGRHYIINMLFDHRLEKPNFSGLVIQEFDTKLMKLVGERTHFFTGTDLGVCEGPQMLKKDGWYYLLAAAGGTGYSHAATISRSKSLMGPYENSPFHPLLSTKTDLSNPLQKSGHASFIEVASDEWYIAHICARPITERGNCTLGRETALQKIKWVDDWPVLENETIHPDVYVPVPSVGADVEQRTDFSEYVDFSKGKIPNSFKSLRRPLGEKMQVVGGKLRLFGEHSPSSLHRQTLLARRWQAFKFWAETEVEFHPSNFQQLAGLILIYDTDNWHYLHMSYDEELQEAYLQVEVAEINQFSYKSDRITIDSTVPVKLGVEVEGDRAQFYYQQENEWSTIGEILPADHLSDDFIKANGKLAFTGAMVGICAQDMNNHQSFADFSYFNYQEN